MSNRKLEEAVGLHLYLVHHAPAELKQAVSNYLAGRGLDPVALIKHYGIGYGCGVGSPLYGRITIPVTNAEGEYVSTVGRILPDNPLITLDPGEPKYWHYSYDKGNHLFNLWNVGQGLRQVGWAIVTEGIFDVFAFHAAGIHCAVAPIAANFSAQQATLLACYCDKFLFCFDNDDAGKRATIKAAKLSKQFGYKPYLIALPPEYKDAGELAAHDPLMLRSAVLEAVAEMEERPKRSVSKLLDRIQGLHNQTSVRQQKGM